MPAPELRSDDTAAGFYNTSCLDVVARRRRGLTGGPFLFYNEVPQFTSRQTTDHQRRADSAVPVVTPEGEQWGTASLVSISFSLLKGREGHRHRGFAAERTAARNPTTAGSCHGLESRLPHAGRCAGFYWPLSITPVTLDWVCRSASFS